MKPAPFYLSYATLAVFGVGLWLGGLWTWLSVPFLFVLLPALDEVARPNRAVSAGERRRWAFDVPLLLWPVAQLATLWLTLTTISRGQMEPAASVGLTVSFGLLSGSIGINVAHELMHRRGRFERGLAELLMTLVVYSHFCVEHVAGHHRNVATPADPATARLGESVYAFFKRVLPGSLAGAWRLERERVGRLGLTPFGLRDRRTRQPLLLLGVLGVVGATFGWLGLAVLAGQSVVAVGLLESINYLEHYGLQRRELRPGQYEPVDARHSWSSSHRFSSWYLFNLARHADHHMIAARPYEQLRSLDAGPELPAGYPAMLLLAWCPPAWFRIMDPLARRWAEDA